MKKVLKCAFDNSYILSSEFPYVWIEVGGLVIRISGMGPDVEVEIYNRGEELGKPLAQCSVPYVPYVE